MVANVLVTVSQHVNKKPTFILVLAKSGHFLKWVPCWSLVCLNKASLKTIITDMQKKKEKRKAVKKTNSKTRYDELKMFQSQQTYTTAFLQIGKSLKVCRTLALQKEKKKKKKKKAF